MTDIEKLHGYKLAYAIHVLTHANEALKWTHDVLVDRRLQDLAEDVRKASVVATQLYCELVESRE